MGKTNIRALIFDYGGVISQPQNLENVKHILQSLKLDYTGFMDVYYRQRIAYDGGQISGEQYWKNVLQHYGLDSRDFDIDHLIREDVQSWTQINEAMLQFIADKRGEIHKLGIISNMIPDTLVYLRSHCDWLTLFDELTFSCELGQNKPELEIYATCLNRLELAPAECLFVDDSAENVKGAIKAGMSAIQYKNFEAFIQELNEKYLITQ